MNSETHPSAPADAPASDVPEAPPAPADGGGAFGLALARLERASLVADARLRELQAALERAGAEKALLRRRVADVAARLRLAAARATEEADGSASRESEEKTAAGGESDGESDNESENGASPLGSAPSTASTRTASARSSATSDSGEGSAAGGESGGESENGARPPESANRDSGEGSAAGGSANRDATSGDL